MKTKNLSKIAPASMAALLSQQAEAFVSFVTPVDPIISRNTTGPSVLWDVDQDGEADFKIINSRTSMTFYKTIRGTGEANALLVTGGSYLLNIPSTTFQVSSGKSFADRVRSVFFNGELSYATGFTSGETGYIGFTFDLGTNAVLSTHYGWAEVVLTEGGNLGTFQINNWAYETEADKPISLGTVPESSHTALGLGALALGAAGIRRWRRQRESRS